MKKIMKVIAIMMLMVVVLTGATPTVTEAKNTKKTSITVTNKSTGKKIGKKLSLTQGKKLQLKVKYGKTNITKKAKYKASNKNVTVNKKGKITVKKAGTATVTIKYKKKTKKIKVTTKAKVVQTTTEQVTTEQATTEVKKSKTNATKEELEQFVEQYTANRTSDPHPECTHEWKVYLYQVDDGSDIANNFAEVYQDRLVLREIYCTKCGDYCVTSPIPYKEVINYTNEDFAKSILWYKSRKTEDQLKHCPKHKCKIVHGYTPPEFPGAGWFGDDRCAYCDALIEN